MATFTDLNPMQRKFLSNVAITLAANMLVKPVWILGIDRTFQNRLGLEQYGLYSNLFTFSLILGLLLDFGINNYNASSLARQPELIRTQFKPLLGLKGLLSLIYMSATLLLGAAYGFQSEQLWLLALLSFNQCMAYASTFFRSNLTGLQEYRKDALISSVDRLTMIVGGSALLLFYHTSITIQTFVYVQTFGYAVAALVSAASLLPHLKKLQSGFDQASIRKVFDQSLPYALLALLMMLYTRSDVLLIKKLLPDGDLENGIYAQSTRLLEAANMFSIVISGLLLPMFAASLSAKEQLQPLLRSAMLVMWLPALMGVSVCWVYAEECMQVLYHTQDAYQVQVFRICLASFIPTCVVNIFGALLTSDGQMRVLIITASTALVVSLAANSILISQMGALGACWVALATHSFVAIANTVVAVKRYQLQNITQTLVKYAILLVLSVSALHVLKTAVFIGLAIPIWALFILLQLRLLALFDFAILKKLKERLSGNL